MSAEQIQTPRDAEGAARSEGRQALPYGLLTVEQILEHTKYRAGKRDNVDVESAHDLRMRYVENAGKADLIASVPVQNDDGSVVMRDLPLSPVAVKTACKLLPGSPSPEVFAASDDPEAFPKFFQNVMDSARRKNRGMLLRHDGLQVNAILPRDYVIKDAYDLLAEFIPALKDNMGEVLGVLGLEQNFGDAASYRIVMGNNIMPSLSDKYGQYLMFNVNTSETGLFDTKTSLGLYRTYCTNSAIRVQSLSRWNHKSAFSPFFDQAARTIRESGYLQESYGKIFEELLRKPLPFPALDLLHAFRKEQIITTGHFDAAEIHVQTEPVETEYDLFNVLTRSAQDLPSLAARENAEANSMKLFTEAGGVLEALRKAEARVRRIKRGPLAGLDEG